MIKAVLQSIPTYALSIFLAPKGVLKEIQTKLSRIWWSGKDSGNFWSMLPCRTLCQPKGIGGIGLRNMRLFNIALLGRQVWKLINNKESLCFKVLSSKYFPDGNIFNAKKVNRASFTWLSIVATVDFLKNGFGWQIGNGDNIKIRGENWGLEGLNRSTLISNMLSSSDDSVKDLWMEHARCWNIEKDGMVSQSPWIFHFEIRLFVDDVKRIRRVSHEILPTNVKIASIRNGFNESYPRCGANAETLIHALCDCTTSREVLTIRGWDLSSNEKSKFIFNGQVDKAQSIWEKASNLSSEFRIYNFVNPPILPQIGDTKKWERPTKGIIKINFDATVNDNRMGYGVIIRDEDGYVLGSGGGFNENSFSVLEAECIALVRSIEVVDKLNILGDVTFETDNAGLVNKLNIGDGDITIIGSRVKKCKEAF
ncbi:hypothetical protein Goshw_016968, partial [Gossypium schwendimanii]|nr:hypothetical protein [Gossypium schwendimanii]